MGVTLRVLNVEDSEDDALLLHRYLSRAGYEVTMERVDTPEAMEDALSQQVWDVVIADYVLPRFSAPAALAMLKARLPHLPFIIISGAVGEETVAMAALRAGAHDYMVKNSLAQFVHAIALTAGVVAEEDRAAVHLMLGKEYLVQDPEPNLAKATYHGEEALALIAEGHPVYAPTLLHLGMCYLGMGQPAESVAILRRYESIWEQLEGPQAALEGEVQYQLGLALQQLGQGEAAARALERAERWFERLGLAGRAEECRQHRGLEPAPVIQDDRWAGHVERGRYCLLTGDVEQAVREVTMALHLAGNDAERAFECYMLLLGCAQKQGHGREALHFGLSARLMAVEVGRHDLGYAANEALTEIGRLLGPRAGEELREVEEEYRKWGLEIWPFLPAALRLQQG